jgi:hypothetical protein
MAAGIGIFLVEHSTDVTLCVCFTVKHFWFLAVIIPYVIYTSTYIVHIAPDISKYSFIFYNWELSS